MFTSSPQDPVCTVDGHSYDRVAIEDWLARGHVASPLTGLPLVSNVLIPNYNLRRVIDWIIQRRPELTSTLPLGIAPAADITAAPGAVAVPGGATGGPVRKWSGGALAGQGVKLRMDGCVARREAPETCEWAMVNLFVDGPLRRYRGDPLGFSIRLRELSTYFGGLRLGVCSKNPHDWHCEMVELVDQHSVLLDGNGWLVLPNTAAVLTGWQPGELRVNDIVACQLTEDGRLVIHVNNAMVVDQPVDLLQAGFQKPPWQAYGFVALSGTAKEVEILTEPLPLPP
eukprot:GHVT01013932.1.p1 GENE.GHVT01013932.1~~GHVT01013932.1.p1  ORF type:complete len:284 (+),score=37.85 GHVT01013932.1:2480-3331(+)